MLLGILATTRTISRGLRRFRVFYYLCLHPLRGGGRTRLVSVPDPHVTPAQKRVWYLTSEFLVVLSQHVWKTGNPIRSLDLKLSCDIKVVHAQQTGYRRRKWYICRSNYTIHVHSTTKKADVRYQTFFHAGVT